MKIIAPLAFIASLAAALATGTLVAAAASAIATLLYTVYGVYASKRLRVHPLNDLPNALRLAAALAAGLAAASALEHRDPMLAAASALLLAAALLVNDEDVRRLYRRLFPHRGFTLALLGIDGAGKSTYSREIARLYQSLGLRATIVPYHRYLFADILARSRRPAATTPPSDVTRYFFTTGGAAKRVARMLLSLLDNTLFYLTEVLPRTLRGEIVILDRFAWSTWIKYWALRYPVQPLKPLWMLIKPDYAIVFDIPGEESYKRILARGNHIPYPPWLLEAERTWYLLLAEKHGYPVIDTTRSIEETLPEVREIALLYAYHALCRKPTVSTREACRRITSLLAGSEPGETGTSSDERRPRGDRHAQ